MRRRKRRRRGGGKALSNRKTCITEPFVGKNVDSIRRDPARIILIKSHYIQQDT